MRKPIDASAPEYKLSGWSARSVDLFARRYIPGSSTRNSGTPPILAHLSAVVSNLTSATGYRDAEIWRSRYLDTLLDRRFLPTTAALSNGARPGSPLSGCTVLSVPRDPAEVLTDLVPRAARLLLHGIGVGLDLTVTRPRLAKEVGGRSSPGPCETLCSILGAVGATMKYAGVKRAAFMATLRVSHPDLLDFIALKSGRSLEDVNVSIALNEYERMAVLHEGEIALEISDADGDRAFTTRDLDDMSESATDRFVDGASLLVRDNDLYWTPPGAVGTAAQLKVGRADATGHLYFSAAAVIDIASRYAWASGDPGLVNLAAIEADNPTSPRDDDPDLVGCGVMTTTTPCGEQPLLPNEMCHLGSVNLASHVVDGRFDDEMFRDTVEIAVRMLDDIIDQSDALDDAANAVVRANRKIGIGVMGLADALVCLQYVYGSRESHEFVERVFCQLQRHATRASERLAVERGPFPNFTHSRMRDEPPRRNATLTTVAPTGHIAALADVSPSIEPFFALAYESRLGVHSWQTNQLLLGVLEECRYSIEEWIAATQFENREFVFDGSLAGMCESPTGDPTRDASLRRAQEVLKTAHELSPEDHTDMVKIVQRYVDNGVSKTVNLAHDAQVSDVRATFVAALDSGLKGITVFRDGCLQEQALKAATACPVCHRIASLEPSDCGGWRCSAERGGCGFDSCAVPA